MLYWNIGYSGMHRYYSCITLYYWRLNPVLVDFLERRNKRGCQMTESKFKVGDKVRSHKFGLGVVTEIYPGEDSIPVEVMWVQDPKYFGYYDSFTSNGQYYENRPDAEKDITLVNEQDDEY